VSGSAKNDPLPGQRFYGDLVLQRTGQAGIVKGEKAKGPDLIQPLTGKPEQEYFIVRSGVLTSISSRQRSAINT